jgi:hypothetical protein
MIMAKWHVRVSKQSFKQGNRLILWGVGGAPQKKNSRFFLFFFKIHVMPVQSVSTVSFVFSVLIFLCSLGFVLHIVVMCCA